jgi:hypothetical protein
MSGFGCVDEEQRTLLEFIKEDNSLKTSLNLMSKSLKMVHLVLTKDA